MITRYDGDKGVCSFIKGRWVDTQGALVIADAPPPVPAEVFTPQGVAQVEQLSLGKDGFHLLLSDGTQVKDNAVLWICKAVPQKVQLDELRAAYPGCAVLQFHGRFSDRDLKAMVDAYQPKLIMAVLGDTELAYLKSVFDGKLIRAEMSVLSGAPAHQRFLEYEAIAVKEWRA